MNSNFLTIRKKKFVSTHRYTIKKIIIKVTNFEVLNPIVESSFSDLQTECLKVTDIEEVVDRKSYQSIDT